ncbi:MAG TPA: glycosyltransferase family 4 protein, partial [Methanosarcina sp.]|nr:glycosyltransferase family 4 protein [Methanosarcina sp.]
EYEVSLNGLTEIDRVIPDWNQRINIISGIGEPFCRKLLVRLIKDKVKWIHWSEGFRFRLRSLITIPLQIFYSRFVINRFALGLLASGSHAYKQYRQWGVERHKLAELPYSIQAPVSTFLPPTSFTFLFLGSIENRKGVDCLLNAFALLPNDWDIKLKVVGRVSDDEGEKPIDFYQQIINQYDIKDKVEFLPPVKVNTIGDTISSCHVLVLPSRFDGFGVVVSEAAALGKTLIASDQVGSAETLIDNCVNGYIFKSENVVALSNCMRAAYRVGFNSRRSNISTNNFTRVEAIQNALRLELILDSLLSME